MRIRFASTAFAACVLISIFSLRQHIRVLADIFHTYSSFYPLLGRHDDLVYKYTPDPANATQLLAPAPKIIHHVALGNANVAKYQDAIVSCKALHPDWTFHLWRDNDATALLAEHYPDILLHYNSYFQNIQRANVLRYAVLHKYGGVYLDLDITCRVAFDSTPLMDLEFVTPGAHPAGVNNAFILTRPGHAFLEHLLRAVPAHDLYWGLPMRLPYIENMLSTGCMFFSNMWMQYADRLVAGHEKQNVNVLADNDGNLQPYMLRGIVETPLMAHGGASSWHGWDAAAIVTIGQHYTLVVAAATVSITLFVVFVIYGCVGTRFRRRRGSWKQAASVLATGLEAGEGEKKMP